jgi:hypothetical protein
MGVGIMKQDAITMCNDALNKLLDVKRAILWKIAEKCGLTPLQIQILQFIEECGGSRKISANDMAPPRVGGRGAKMLWG